jgi:glycosyltransferase involved in cell wall biosynthesis
MITSKKSITYIISNINKAITFEWISQTLDRNKYDLSFILLNNKNTFIEDYLKNNSIWVRRIQYKNKKDLPLAVYRISKLLKELRTDVIHTHLLDASLAGLIAAFLIRVPKRIHTRRHSTYHHQYCPKATNYDRLINFLSTDIIATSINVRDVLVEREHVKPPKVHVINNCFNLRAFQDVPHEDIEILRRKYKIGSHYPVIGVIARYIVWKGIPFIIDAFKHVLKIYPDALMILANADGPDKRRIQLNLKFLPDESFVEIRFENNHFALYKLFDVYVHVPVDSYIEAFGQTYIEALAAGVPSVFTLSGIANEFIEHKKNALVVDYQNPEQIADSIHRILEDKRIAQTLVKNGLASIQRFSLERMIKELEHLYG